MLGLLLSLKSEEIDRYEYRFKIVSTLIPWYTCSIENWLHISELSCHGFHGNPATQSRWIIYCCIAVGQFSIAVSRRGVGNDTQVQINIEGSQTSYQQVRKAPQHVEHG